MQRTLGVSTNLSCVHGACVSAQAAHDTLSFRKGSFTIACELRDPLCLQGIAQTPRRRNACATINELQNKQGPYSKAALRWSVPFLTWSQRATHVFDVGSDSCLVALSLLYFAHVSRSFVRRSVRPYVRTDESRYLRRSYDDNVATAFEYRQLSHVAPTVDARSTPRCMRAKRRRRLANDVPTGRHETPFAPRARPPNGGERPVPVHPGPRWPPYGFPSRPWARSRLIAAK
jgi:hypothetical protein